jgi:hypothetical protein
MDAMDAMDAMDTMDTMDTMLVGGTVLIAEQYTSAVALDSFSSVDTKTYTSAEDMSESRSDVYDADVYRSVHANNFVKKYDKFKTKAVVTVDKNGLRTVRPIADILNNLLKQMVFGHYGGRYSWNKNNCSCHVVINNQGRWELHLSTSISSIHRMKCFAIDNGIPVSVATLGERHYMYTLHMEQYSPLTIPTSGKFTVTLGTPMHDLSWCISTLNIVAGYV